MRILREVKLGMKVTEVCPRYGISEQTYYRWKAKYAEPEVHQAVRIRQLQEENEQLRERLTTLGVEHQELKDRLRIE